MTTRAVAEMDDWDTVSFSGGYAGLRDLADAEFSGIVRSGAAKCCLLNGTVVGVLDGRIEDFEDSEGTAYRAPTPALPLLALMQERGDEVRAKYYTEDTPLSEVDRTLSEGGFSGYIELSENVLSGDYYVVYHAGRSMSVAWVGNMGELLTDDEAFRRADDEVGIYEVRQVDVDPVEIPGQSGGSSAGAAAGADAGGTAASERPGGETADGEPARGDSSEAERAATATETDGRAGAVGADERPAAGEAGGETVTGATSSPTTGDDASASDGHETAGEGTDGSDETQSAGAAGASGQSADSTASGPEQSAASVTDSEGADDARSEADNAGPGTDGSTGVDRPGSTRSRADSAVEESSSASRTEPSGTGEPTETTSVDETTEAAVADSTAAESTDAGPERVEDSDDRRKPRDVRASSDADGTAATADDPGDARDGGSDAVSPAERLATRSVPSLDPSRTTDDEDSDGVVGGAVAPDSASSGTSDTDVGRASASRAPPSPGASESTPEQEETGDTGRDRPGSRSDADPRAAAGASGDSSRGATESESEDDSRTSAGERGRTESSDRVTQLEAELDERDAEIERLESELATAESERADLRRELEAAREDRDALQSERDELAAELDKREAELEAVRSELQELEAEFGGASDTEQRLSPSEALDGTNLFVRYASKGKATLESAHGGSVSREEVNENLNLELHTQFDAGSATVGSQPYEEFLRETLPYRFVDWAVRDLLWEIRETGKIQALEDFYDAIPEIDRAELSGTVSVEFTEEGQQRHSEESFDVVLRDRMGNPLVVANLNDSRQAASQEMMDTLVTAGSRVAESSASLAAAVFVTSSFFEPEALETAADATSGSLLSRDKRESFVKLSRKQGYHLCLTEARGDQFHLAVPDL